MDPNGLIVPTLQRLAAKTRKFLYKFKIRQKAEGRRGNKKAEGRGQKGK